MSLIDRIFKRSGSRPRVEHDPKDVETEANDAIILLYLAGFRPAKIRLLLETIPSFKKVDCHEYKAGNIELFFKGMSGRRDPELTAVLEHGASAAALRAQALDIYKVRVLDRGFAEPDTPAEAKAEEGAWLQRWTEQVRQLNVHQRRQLEFRFGKEIGNYVRKMGEGAARKVLDEDSARMMMNLGAFQESEPDRRAAMSAKPALNNRRPLTPRLLQAGYKTSPKSQSTEGFLPPPGSEKGWDGQGVRRPGSAQSLDVEGKFVSRPPSYASVPSTCASGPAAFPSGPSAATSKSLE